MIAGTPIQIVIDTNVFISAITNNTGASFYLFSLVGKKHFEINISVPLILEYESVATRLLSQTNLNEHDLSDILDYLCLAANKHEIDYLWRPFLNDPKDDFVLELAVKSNSQFIITFNKKDFIGISRFGIHALTPWEFLNIRGLI